MAAPLPAPLPPPISSSNSTISYNLRILFFAAIAVCLISAALHLLRHLLSHPRPSFLLNRRNFTTSSSTSSPSPPEGHNNTTIANSLPLFSFSDVTGAVSNSKSSSTECSVCLSRFRPGDQLRLLPACSHAFHTRCIEAWLRSSVASCPLCRCPIDLATRPPPSPSPQSPGVPAAPPGHEVNAELAVEEAGKGWLKEYVDRLVSSASSPFSSFRLSERWSRRFNNVEAWNWDFEDGEAPPELAAGLSS